MQGGRNFPLTMGTTARRFRFAEARRNQWRLGALAGLVLVAILLHTTAEASHVHEPVQCCQSMVTAGGGSGVIPVGSLLHADVAGLPTSPGTPAVLSAFRIEMLSLPTAVLVALLI